MNHTIHYTAVIVGGGPSGSACAIRLAQSNINCCIVDKAKFPRNKLCAGLTTEKTRRLLFQLLKDRSPEDILSAINRNTVHGIKLFQGYEEFADQPFSKEWVLVNRRDYDNLLVDHFRNDLGGDVYDGISIKKYDLAQHQLLLDDGTILSYDYLIAADGAAGHLATLCGCAIAPEKKAFCLEINVNSGDFDYENDKVGIYFNVLKGGYVWVFPKGDTVCLGLGCLYDHKTDYKKVFQDFLTETGLRNPENYPLSGAFLPYGTCNPRPFSDEFNVLFVGDSAGYADPITGEGLYLAFQSGINAADSLAEGLGNGKTFEQVAADYTRSMKPFARIIKKGALMQKLLYTKPILFSVRTAVKIMPKLVTRYCDKMISQYDYDYLFLIEMLFH